MKKPIKPIIGVIALVLAITAVAASIFGSDIAEPVKLNGDFVPDQAKSITWMKENRYPGIEGEGKLERYKNAAYSGPPPDSSLGQG